MKKSYKSMQDELDNLIEWFDSEEIDIDAAAEKYRQAEALIAEMQLHLERAENSITEIKSAKKAE